MDIEYNKFNRLYENFIDTLISFFPHITKIEYYNELFHQVMKNNYRLPAKYFLVNVGPYAEYILSENDDYFKNVIQNEQNSIEKTIITEWDGMTDVQRKTVWFYLKNLLQIVQNIEFDDEEDENA